MIPSWRRFTVGGKLFETNGPVVRLARGIDAMEIEAIIRRHASHAAEHPCFASMHIFPPELARGSWYLRIEYDHRRPFVLFPLQALGDAVRNETGMDLLQALWIEYADGFGATWFWKARWETP